MTADDRTVPYSLDAIAEAETIQLTTVSPARSVWLRLAAGFTGILVGGWALLALGLAVTGIVAGVQHFSGPGWVAIGAHLAAVAVAIAAQRRADRRSGRVAWAGVLVVLALSAAVLWWFWLW